MLHWKRYYMNLHFQSAEGAALVSIFAREKFLKVKFGASLFQEMRSLTYMDAAPAWNALCIVPEHKYIKRGILNKEFQDLCRWTFLKWNRRLDNHVNQAIIPRGAPVYFPWIPRTVSDEEGKPASFIHLAHALEQAFNVTSGPAAYLSRVIL